MSADADVLDIFAKHAAAGDSGILTVTRGKQKRLFCLQAGRPVFVASNVLEEQLTTQLVEEGRLTGDTADALLVQARRRGVQATRLLADVDGLDDAAVRGAMARWIVRLAVETFTWERASATFGRGTPKLEGEPIAPVDTIDLFRAYAADGRVDDARLRRRLSPTSRPVRWTGLAERASAGRSLDAAERHLLAHADGSQTLDAVLASCPDPGGLQAAFALILAGWLVLELPRSAAPGADGLRIPEDVTELSAWLESIDAGDHYSVLQLPRDSDRDTIRDRYYKLARRLHPDRFRATGGQELVSRIERYFAHVTEAYNTLEHPETRQEYDRELAEREERGGSGDAAQEQAAVARRNYLHGRGLADRRRFHEAVGFLRNAAKMAPDESEYVLAYAEMLVRNPRERAEAERQLLRAIDLAPSDPRAYELLGRLYARSGHKRQAATVLQEALRWDPTSAEATAALAELDVPDSPAFVREDFRGLYDS